MNNEDGKFLRSLEFPGTETKEGMVNGATNNNYTSPMAYLFLSPIIKWKGKNKKIKNEDLPP